MSIHRMPIDGEVVSSRRIPIPGAPDRPLPEAPKTDIQRGFLGFGNPVDVESARRKRLLQRVAEELQYGERLGLSLEVSGIKDIRAANRGSRGCRGTDRARYPHRQNDGGGGSGRGSASSAAPSKYHECL